MIKAFKNIKPGIVLVMIGFLGMAFSLGNHSLGKGEKIAIFILCLFATILGMVLQSPLSQYLNEPEPEGFN